MTKMLDGIQRQLKGEAIILFFRIDLREEQRGQAHLLSPVYTPSLPERSQRFS